MADGTAELAVVVDDPDATGGTYVHWIVTGLAPTTVAIDAGKLPDGAHQATNSAGKTAYAPPLPAQGEHRYRFTVYAVEHPHPRRWGIHRHRPESHSSSGERPWAYQRSGVGLSLGRNPSHTRVSAQTDQVLRMASAAMSK